MKTCGICGLETRATLGARIEAQAYQACEDCALDALSLCDVKTKAPRFGVYRDNGMSTHWRAVTDFYCYVKPDSAKRETTGATLGESITALHSFA